MTYQEEETVTCSVNDQNTLQQALVDICLSWIPSKVFQQGKKCDSCFHETLELVMTCLCEEAANMTSLSSILKVLHWVETQLNHWDSAIPTITLNKSRCNLPVLFESFLSLHAKLLGMSDTKQNTNEISTVDSATQVIPQKPVLDALHLLSNICRTLSEKYTFEDSSTSKSDPSHVLQSFLKQIAVEFQT